MNTPYASASLYVGDLAGDVTEGMLFEIFNPVGPVASIRVCRDAVTRRSLGYAYVNYHNPGDAERALNLNHTLIKGRPCRIMWSQRDPSLRKSGVGNIFIKNLDKSIDNNALHDTFSAFGNILSCKVVTDENNVSKGYGFVHYETQESADKAIQKVNAMMLNNQKVFVGPFIPRKERLLQKGETEQKFTNVYFKNLDEGVTETQLRDMAGRFGTITNAAIASQEDGKSKGFGFVNFENPEAAKRAVEEMNTMNINGKTLYVGRAQKKSEREAELRSKFEQLRLERLNKYQGVNLYIKNLEDNVDDEKLRAEFSQFGNITSAKVMKVDDKSNSKGFGFVCFSTPDEATRAVTEMNGRIMGTKPLYVALAQRKEVRKAQLEAQHAQRAKGSLRPGNAPGPIPAPMYPPGAPVFYTQPQSGALPPNQAFVYPQMIGTRQRPWPQGQYPPMANYVVGPQVAHRQPHNNRQRGVSPQQVGGPAGANPAGGNRRGGPGRNRNDQQGMNAAAAQPAEANAAAPAANAQNAAPATQQTPTTTMSAQEFGERIYAHISKTMPDLAPKITGMLIHSMSLDELAVLLDNEAALNAKVQEAIEVLNAPAST